MAETLALIALGFVALGCLGFAGLVILFLKTLKEPRRNSTDSPSPGEVAQYVGYVSIALVLIGLLLGSISAVVR